MVEVKTQERALNKRRTVTTKENHGKKFHDSSKRAEVHGRELGSEKLVETDEDEIRSAWREHHGNVLVLRDDRGGAAEVGIRRREG